MSGDEIEIRRQQVETHIGVPEGERSTPQSVWISVWMQPAQGFDGLQDKVGNTVDYHEVSLSLSAIAISRPRHLIETLASDIAGELLQCFPLKSVQVKVEKKVLPNTEFVAVKIRRER
ncbi:MAG: dihydroneopterin aldolase [Armatimonadetes bacterium]|nr:dihydroneopterin aldolase [Akkermansiaceae bacterium]